MWLYVPSLSAPGSPVLTSESPVFSQLAQSATWNGKLRPPKSWWREWKKGGLTPLRSTLTSEPSTVNLGVEKWISSLPDCLANHSLLPENGSARTTTGTCGRSSSGSSGKCDPPWSSWKMYRASLSSLDQLEKNYANWVTKLRRSSLQRRKSGRPIRGNGSSVWPTARSTNGSKGGPNQRGSKGDLMLPSMAAQWATPHANAVTGSGTQGRDGGKNLQTQVDLWMTPNTPGGGRSVPEETVLAKGQTSTGKRTVGLESQTKFWPTATASPQGGRHQWAKDGKGGRDIKSKTEAFHPTPTTTKPGATCWQSSLLTRRLSPYFVEKLMGFPVGWTER